MIWEKWYLSLGKVSIPSGISIGALIVRLGMGESLEGIGIKLVRIGNYSRVERI